MAKAERIITIARDVTCLVVGATGILWIVFTLEDPTKVNDLLLGLLGSMVGVPTLIGAVSLVRSSRGAGESGTTSEPSPSTQQLPPSSSSST